MSKLDGETGETFQPRQGLRTGYSLVRCPKSGCGYILFEASKRFWSIQRIEKMVCLQCEHSASLIAILQPEHDAGELVIRYWCHKCESMFEKTMLGVRGYCRGCKTYQNIYFSLSMAFPQIPPEAPEMDLAA